MKITLEIDAADADLLLSIIDDLNDGSRILYDGALHATDQDWRDGRFMDTPSQLHSVQAERVLRQIASQLRDGKAV